MIIGENRTDLTGALAECGPQGVSRAAVRLPRRASAWVGATAIGLATYACAGQRSVDTRPAVSGLPVITRLSPSSGPAGQAYPIHLTIHGTGFHITDNVVAFGPVTIPGLTSTDDGTQIVLSVPKVLPSTGEVPPFVLLPGDYDVKVTTPKGTSSPMTFTLVRRLDQAS